MSAIKTSDNIAVIKPGGGLDIETYQNEYHLIINVAYRMKVSEMKEVRKLLTKFIAEKKREGITD